MKRWSKKNGRWLITGLGVLFITNAAYGLFTPVEESKFLLHASVIVVWLLIVVFSSGAIRALLKFWEKD